MTGSIPNYHYQQSRQIQSFAPIAPRVDGRGPEETWLDGRVDNMRVKL